MANKRSHTTKTVNWWHEGGECCSVLYSFSSYSEKQILPPLQLLLLHRMSKLFLWCACVQPGTMHRAYSRRGWISAQIDCRMSRIPLLGPFTCGIIHKPLPGNCIHTCLVISERFIYCPECIALACLCCCLTGGNQSVPRNLAFHMQIIELSCFWSSSKEPHLWKRKLLEFNVDLYLCTARCVLVK